MIKMLTPSMWGSVVLALMAAVPVAAEETRARVVLVGIDKYADPQIKPHPKAEADARALHDLFTDKDHLGVPKEDTRLLLGKDATRAKILDAVDWLVRSSGPDDVAIFGFFGSGGPLDTKTCYFASDSTFKGREKNAVSADDIGEELDKLKSKRFSALLDVNFKGYDVPKDQAPDFSPSNLYREYLGKDDNATGRLVFLANRGLTPSQIDKDHGVFAQVLLDGLTGKADTDGYEPDGVITSAELAEYIDKQVLARTRELGKPEPAFSVGRASPYVLTRNPEVTPKVKQQVDKLRKLARAKVLPATFVDEGAGLLSRMPKLESDRELRQSYQQLVAGTLPAQEFMRERRRILDNRTLPAEDARRFASKVMQAINQVADGYVEKLNRGEMTSWAVKGLFEAIDEPVPASLARQLEAADKLDADSLNDLLASARRLLGKREDLDDHKDIDHALQKMLGHLDPYTTYIDPETVSQFLRDIRRNYTGVGVQIRKDLERDMLRVVTPIKGSPAYRAGLKAGDIITTIKRSVDGDGRPLAKAEIISTQGLSISDAVKKVLGKADTKVTLTVEREGVDKPFDIEITRASIELETVNGFRRNAKDDNWEYVIDPENRILYVRLTGFASNTARDLRRIVTAASRNGVKGMILDLRFNPGGLLRSAVSICDMFIDDGEIVSIRPRVGEAETHGGKRGGFLDFPMVVLVNGGSASASEIVSACLQDHKRAKIIGERSFGKGSVQNIHPFDGGQLKLTIASFWRPNGKNLNKASTKGRDDDVWGVTPDILIKLPRAERDKLAEFQLFTEIIQRKDVEPKKNDFKDRQLDAALEHLRRSIKLAAQDRLRKAS